VIALGFQFIGMFFGLLFEVGLFWGLDWGELWVQAHCYCTWAKSLLRLGFNSLNNAWKLKCVLNVHWLVGF
jgi:hypothetical protein